LVKNFLLQIYEVLVIHDPIPIFVANPEDSKERLLVFGLELLLYRIIKRRYRVQDRPLRRGYYIDQIDVDFGRALDAHLHLLELLEMVV
jgi:hypothetical protein